MPKIYNEIVIDMNPESPTFEETLYEDSFDYNGDMMLMQNPFPTEGDQAAIRGEEHLVDGKPSGYFNYTYYKYKDGEWTFYYDARSRPDNLKGNNTVEYGSESEFPKSEEEQFEADYQADQELDTDNDGVPDVEEQRLEDIESSAENRSWGAETITKEDFIQPDGTPRTIEGIYNTLDRKLPGITGEALYKQIQQMMPQYQEVSEEELGFLTDDERISTGLAEQTFEEAKLAKDKAGDVYGLGVSAAEREKAGIEEAYGLGMSAAERTKQAGLGQLQQQAGQLGAQMRGAYGGMGGGMRGAIGGQAAMAKGVGTTYDIAAGEATRLAGAQERGLGAVSDEMTRLEQEKGYAATRFGVAEERRDLALEDIALTKEKGVYGLEEGAREDFETDIMAGIEAGWVLPGEDATGAEQTTFGAWMRGGGRVPSKENFSHFLTQLPDAGGS